MLGDQKPEFARSFSFKQRNEFEIQATISQRKEKGFLKEFRTQSRAQHSFEVNSGQVSLVTVRIVLQELEEMTEVGFESTLPVDFLSELSRSISDSGRSSLMNSTLLLFSKLETSSI